MRTPAIVVNFKVYPEMDGDGSLNLARICEEVAHETGVNIVVCPPMVELSRIAREISIPVFSQHVDVWKGGACTGRASITGIKAAGAKGTLINHSERRLLLADMEELIRGSRIEGLDTIVCTNNVEVSRAAAAMGPNFVAMEPPELIGGDISVTTADPGIVRRTVDAVDAIDPGVKVLTGAGVKTRDDVEMAIKLGTHGVLLASGVVKAKDPRKVLLSLARGLI
ncbi:MAG: triose-phosphate isomerase [Thermoplasmatota archaeon]